MKPNNNFGIWRPYWVLTAQAILSEEQPVEMLLNEGILISKDFGDIMVQKQTQFTKEPQNVEIQCPEGYMRIMSFSQFMPVFFAKRTNKNVFPSNLNDLDTE
jgi:hypothetical protein